MECETLESDENRIVLKDKGNEGNKNTDKFIIQNAYIDQDGNYLQNKGKYEPKYSMYFYKEINDEEDQEDNYLLLRLEIPGNIIKLTARKTVEVVNNDGSLSANKTIKYVRCCGIIE